MRILGLDPGSLHTGYGVIQSEGGRVGALAVGRISCQRTMAQPARLAHLSREAKELVQHWRPDVVVVETPFRGVNNRSLIILAEARGALVAAVALAEVEVREFAPAEIKLAVTGSGRADKEQVARMVRVLLKLDAVPLAADETDALAVALCCAQRMRMDGLSAGK